VHVHRLAEPADDPLGAQAAGLVFIGIAAFGDQHLLVFNGHAAAADPVFAVARVNVVVVGQTRKSLEWDNLARISDRLRGPVSNC